MNKKLPNVFANKNVGTVKNNKKVFYSKEETNNMDIPNENIKHIIIRKKINDLFNSNNFVYKVRVAITTGEGDKEYTLIHRNNNSLLTIDNESIPIDEIIDIRKL